MKWRLFCILFLILGTSWGCKSREDIERRENIHKEILERIKAQIEAKREEAEFQSIKPKEHLERMKSTEYILEAESLMKVIDPKLPEYKEAQKIIVQKRKIMKPGGWRNTAPISETLKLVCIKTNLE